MNNSQPVTLEDLIGIFDRYLADYNRYLITPLEVWEPMHYSLSSGGKRLRPTMLLAVLATQSIDLVTRGLKSAMALEYIHTYSLIHDDLPAMDDDDYRRGKLSNHKAFGEDRAILAGDALLTDAFGLIASDDNLRPDQVQALVRALSDAAGSTGMVAGQVGDMLMEGQEVDLEQLEANHQLKTGKLFAFALEAGAIIGDLPQEERDLLNQFADHFGAAYQIHNDLMDLLGSQEGTGKAVGRDQALDKATYPGLLGEEGARNQLQSQLEACQQVVQDLNQTVNQDYSLLANFLDYLEVPHG